MIEGMKVMGQELLFEIGTEEIPAGYLKPAIAEMGRLAEKALQENRIQVTGGFETYGTPRRLVLVVKGVAEKQEDLLQELTGPPSKVAFDKEGRATKAALGFAQKQGVSVEELGTIETPKGEYLFIKKQIPGRAAGEILAKILPGLIPQIPWPKSMRWGDVGFPFVRPVHWVLALLGGEIIPFEIAGVKSGNTTRGHRFMAPEEKPVSGWDQYMAHMREGFVVVDQAERERTVEKIAREAAKTVGGKPTEDPELVAINANLVEYPSAVCGAFESRFLDIPDPVLITAMREHQKYFAVLDDEGRLMPHFVAINNTVAGDESVVSRGHERVLRARLSDADFFFKEDRKRPLMDRLEDLKGVIYQADLGTSHAKVGRFTKLAEYLAEKVLPGRTDEVKTTAALCKCDLVTQMVGEFPSLQGVMGKEYATLEGYAEEVCLAIHEHYLPARSGGQLPTTTLGAVVGCADRMDTIVGCFAVGMEPSGSADPFALRRHALALIRIWENRGWELPLQDFVRKGLSVLADDIEIDRDSIFGKVMEFFRERYRQRMLRKGFDSDLIEAVISVQFDRLTDLPERIEQLRQFASESEEFQALIQTFKRVGNILKKQPESFEVDENLLSEDCETGLLQAYHALRAEVAAYVEKGDYKGALNVMARLREPVDAFFEGVEIMVKDNEPLRRSRVGLLQRLSGLFRSVADLSKFSI